MSMGVLSLCDHGNWDVYPVCPWPCNCVYLWCVPIHVCMWLF